jgi:hypothetical protein
VINVYNAAIILAMSEGGLKPAYTEAAIAILSVVGPLVTFFLNSRANVLFSHQTNPNLRVPPAIPYRGAINLGMTGSLVMGLLAVLCSQQILRNLSLS